MKIKKLISILITISILFSAVSVSFAEEKEYYNLELTKVNEKLLQAEDMTLDEGIAKVEENENAFNGKQVRLLAGKGEAISFNVTPAKIPQIVFWMRYSAENLSSNTVTFYLDGKKQVCELPVTGKDKFQWIKIGAVNFPGMRTHTLKLRIHPNESNIIADAFYITDSGTYYPSNNEIDFAFKYEMLTQASEGLPPSGLKPIEGHPRVMFTKDDIPRLKESLYAPENAEAYKELEKLINSEVTGKLRPVTSGMTSNLNNTVNGVIEALAFSYIITGNEEHGRRAISVLKEMLDSFIFVTGNSSYHDIVHNIYLGAVVYDWCFDLLTEDDKKFIVYYCQRQIQDMGTMAYGDGYPYLFKTRGVISSTVTITNPHQGPLAFSIAIYDEYPELFDYLSSVEVELFKPAGNYIIEGGAHPSGSSYGMSRMYGMYYAHYLLKTACGGYELYNEDKLVDMSLAWIYDKNPDGFRYRYGDQAVYTTADTDYASHSKDTAAHMIAAYLADDSYKKSVIKQFVFQENPNLGAFINYQEVITPISVFVFNDLSVPAQSYKGLPLTRYFPEPIGRMIAKTGWTSGRDSKDATVVMNIKTEVTTNHGHPDAGTFQIFYKGLVAPDLSHYNLMYPPHYPGHNTQTISHNGLLILDPNEYDYGSGYNSGGQKLINSNTVSFPKNIEDHIRRLDEFTTGEIIGMEYGPDKYFPEYSYLAGDITKAYSDKVSEVRRSMMFMPTENEEYPAVFFVMDKIDAKKASFKKTYLLQAFEEPEVNNENTVTLNTATNDYNGSAVNQTLYPEVNIEAIGGPGKAWFVNGENLVPRGQTNDSTAIGWGRVEVTPKEANNLDYLMNVIYVKDADNDAEIQKAELIDTDELLGAKIFDKVSLFAKSSERLTDEFSFKVEGEGKVDIAVTGISRGEWEITVNGNSIGTQISTDEGGMIYFNADCGEIKIKKVSEKSNKVFTENAYQGDLASDVEFKYNKKLRYSKTPLTIMNGTCYIPIETFFNVINGETIYSEDGKSATGSVGSTKISVTEGSDDVKLIIGNKDISFTNTHPIISINGSLMLPARKVFESVGGIVKWGAYPPTLDVSLDADVLSIVGEIPIVNSTMTTEHEASENAYMTYDKNRSTIWTAGGDDAWIIWEFDDTYTVKSFIFDANQSMSDRKYLFELYYSSNGKNWTSLYNGSSPGDGSKLYYNLESPVNAKYIKYVGHQNTISVWNNVAEIMFCTEPLDLSKYGGKK